MDFFLEGIGLAIALGVAIEVVVTLSEWWDLKKSKDARDRDQLPDP